MKSCRSIIINIFVTCAILGIGATVLSLLSVDIASAEAGTIDVCSDPGDDCSKVNGFIKRYINPAIEALTALVGIIAVLSIVIAGIQYASSADDPGVVTKAKQRIFNVVLGLVVYVFLVALLNYLVPGGIW